MCLRCAQVVTEQPFYNGMDDTRSIAAKMREREKKIMETGMKISKLF